jgi:hypothetical protein
MAAVNFAQSKRQMRVDRRLSGFGLNDLLQDEFQIDLVEISHDIPLHSGWMRRRTSGKTLPFERREPPRPAARRGYPSGLAAEDRVNEGFE